MKYQTVGRTVQAMHSRHSIGDITIMELMGVVMMNIMIFLPFLEDLHPVLGYFDEALSITLLIALVYAVLSGKEKISNRHWLIIALFVCVVVVGFIGNLSYGYLDSAFYMLVDALSCGKYIIAFCAFSILLKDTRKFVGYMALEGKVLLVLAFVCLILEYTIGIGMSRGSVRYGLEPFAFVFNHTTHMVIMVFVCYLFVSAISKGPNFIYLGITVVLMLSSLRSRWIALAAILLILAFLFRRGDRKIQIGHVLVFAIISIAIGYNQYVANFASGSDNIARERLQDASLEIMIQYAPFGSGFGTFGSGVTKVVYSPLYYQYGLNTVYGCTPSNPSFLTDTFWSVVFAQFGLIGTLLWISILLFSWWEMYRVSQNNGATAFSIAAIAALAISTTSSGSIFSVHAILIVFAVLAITNALGYERDGSVWLSTREETSENGLF